MQPRYEKLLLLKYKCFKSYIGKYFLPKIVVLEASTNTLGTSLALIFTGRYSATAVRSDGR